MLISGRYKDTAGGVLGFGASVEADACTPRDLLEDRKEPLEAWGLRDGDAIDEGGDHLIGVFEGRTDGYEGFSEAEGVDFIESTSDGFIALGSRDHRTLFTDEFVIHRANYF